MPSLPDDPRGAGVVAGIVGGVFGLAVTVWANGIGVNPPMIVPILAVTTAVAAAVPVGAAIHRGLIAPTVCFAVFVVPGLLRQTFTASEGGPVFLLLLGPIAVVFVLLGYAEFFVRIRLRGRFGGWLDAIL